MRRMAALLVVAALLAPAFALATEPMAEEPVTFDFTVEEWLARYKAIVPEEDAFYFEEFEVNEPVLAPVETQHGYEHFFNENGLIQLRRELGGEKINVASAIVLLNAPELDDNILASAGELLRSMAKRCLLATQPLLTEDEIESILINLGFVKNPSMALFRTFNTEEIDGLYYTFDFYGKTGCLIVSVSTIPYEDAILR